MLPGVLNQVAQLTVYEQLGWQEHVDKSHTSFAAHPVQYSQAFSSSNAQIGVKAGKDSQPGTDPLMVKGTR